MFSPLDFVPSVKYEQETAIISDVSNATEAPLRAYQPLNGADLYFDTTARIGGNCIEYWCAVTTVIGRARESVAINIGFTCIYAITVTHVKIASWLGDEVPESTSNFVKVLLNIDNETRTIEHLHAFIIVNHVVT